jgi:two-component system response regulator (stage 0 sporulation protein F)
MFKSVLVADRDVESRDRFYEILFSVGNKVECAPNANEVFNRLETERPYLLILAEDLPSEGGLRALEKIRQFDHEMKVVFLTKEEPDIEIETKAHRLGVSVVMKKDFSTHFMFKKILEILRQPEEEIMDNKYMGMGKILVVDDMQEMRVTLATFLKMKGFEAKDVASAEQALLEIKIERPILVLLDERMPGMDGLVALKKIKEIDSSIKVVMLTAVEDEDVMEEAKKLGALDYITKPFDLEKLEAMILSILIQEKYKKER